VTPQEAAAGLPAAFGSRGPSLACAESCTGGLASAAITSIPGSSEYFLGGIVSYSNEAKERLLGVLPGTISSYGAVSSETAAEMARGAAKAFRAESAFSITGVAGPGGGSDEKPVGTVWFGFFARDSVTTERIHFEGDRLAVREAAAEFAIRRMIDFAAERNRA